MKKGKKQKLFRICFAGAVIESVYTGQKERHYQAPGNHTQHLSIKLWAVPVSIYVLSRFILSID